MKKNLTASIIIPVRNRPAEISRLLYTLSAQTAPRSCFEVIVSDDGSEEILMTPARFYGDIYLHSPRTGQGGARNRGLQVATGDIIIFLDSDIQAHPRLVEAHIKAHKESDGISLLGGIEYPPGHEKFRLSRLLDAASYTQNLPENIPLSPNKFLTCNISIPRKILLESGGFEQKFCQYGYEDIELGWRLYKNHKIPLFHRKNALAWHLNHRSPEKWVETALTAGSSSLLLFQLHPDSAQPLNLPAFEAIKIMLKNADFLKNGQKSEFFPISSWANALNNADTSVKDNIFSISSWANALNNADNREKAHQIMHNARIFGALLELKRLKGEKGEIFAEIMETGAKILAKNHGKPDNIGIIYAKSRGLFYDESWGLAKITEKNLYQPWNISNAKDALKSLLSPAMIPINIFRPQNGPLTQGIYNEIVDKTRRITGTMAFFLKKIVG